ncbi:MAG: hypothetical protein GY794_11575 [bacterium]|nr:hypothetical protein [bacterium]
MLAVAKHPHCQGGFSRQICQVFRHFLEKLIEQHFGYVLDHLDIYPGKRSSQRSIGLIIDKGVTSAADRPDCDLSLHASPATTLLPIKR